MVPALLIKASSFPHFFKVSFTVWAQDSGCETSAFKTIVSAPNVSHSLLTSFAASIELEQVIAMFQPLLARSFETSAPTPLLPPVTIATGLVIFIPPLQK